MFTKKSKFIRWNRWIPFTIINLLQVSIFFEPQELPVALLFYLGIFFNQYMLFIVVADLTGIKKNTSLMPTWFCASSKLLALLISFGIAMSYTTGKELILLEIYIFQLIILVLSIKRVVKKN